MGDWNVEEMDERIKELRRLSEELKEMGQGIPAVEQNIVRMLACVKMLELNISDIGFLE